MIVNHDFEYLSLSISRIVSGSAFKLDLGIFNLNLKYNFFVSSFFAEFSSSESWWLSRVCHYWPNGGWIVLMSSWSIQEWHHHRHHHHHRHLRHPNSSSREQEEEDTHFHRSSFWKREFRHSNIDDDDCLHQSHTPKAKSSSGHPDHRMSLRSSRHDYARH